MGNIAWDTNGRYLANLVAEQIARKSFRSHQYYELELDGNVSYNHTTLWGTSYYKPINLSISERSTRVTYRGYRRGFISCSDMITYELPKNLAYYTYVILDGGTVETNLCTL